jgi:hypothetical protein
MPPARRSRMRWTCKGRATPRRSTGRGVVAKRERGIRQLSARNGGNEREQMWTQNAPLHRTKRAEPVDPSVYTERVGGSSPSPPTN